MAYSKEIDGRITRLVADWQGVDRKKMFCGTCHLLTGHMFCGVSGDRLILRVGQARAAELLNSALVAEFDITGRPMKGWVMVSAEAFQTDKELLQLLDLARQFVLSLPPKTDK